MKEFLRAHEKNVRGVLSFVNIEDMDRAQAFSDRFTSLDWPALLDEYARRVNPLMSGILSQHSYYWVTAQSEYSTDVLFRSRASLQELSPKLISHSMHRRSSTSRLRIPVS
jgi:hypothetical protein